MLRPFGPGLPSDAIAHRYGFEGNEPRETGRVHSRYAALGVRSAFAINTFYQETASGYYENYALFALIDRAWRSLGLFPVRFDDYRETGLVPVEGEGHLLVGEQYVLVSEDQKVRGVLQTWRFHAGGGGCFYSDNIVFDLILPEGVTRQLVDEAEARCRTKSVRFSREAEAKGS